MFTRIRLLALYSELLGDLPVKPLKVPKDALSSARLAAIRLHQNMAEKRRQLFEGLQAERVGVQLHYSLCTVSHTTSSRP